MLPPLLADVNIAAEVVAFLQAAGVDVETLVGHGWAAQLDDQILAEALAMHRFVLTHDADFGRLAIAERQPFHGVLYLRPGDLPPARVIADLRPLLTKTLDWTPPMLAVYRAGRLRIRRPRR